MEVNYLIFRNPKIQPLSDAVQSRVKWIPCTKADFLERPITPLIGIKRAVKIENPVSPTVNPLSVGKGFRAKGENLESLNVTANATEGDQTTNTPSNRIGSREVTFESQVFSRKPVLEPARSSVVFNAETFIENSPKRHKKPEIPTSLRKNQIVNSYAEGSALADVKPQSFCPTTGVPIAYKPTTPVKNTIFGANKTFNAYAHQPVSKGSFLEAFESQNSSVLKPQAKGSTQSLLASAHPLVAIVHHRISSTRIDSNSSILKNFGHKLSMGPDGRRPDARASGSRPRIDFSNFKPPSQNTSFNPQNHILRSEPSLTPTVKLNSFLNTPHRRQAIGSMRNNPQPVIAKPRYNLQNSHYETHDNGKEYLIAQNKVAHRHLPQRPKEDCKFPCLSVTPRENRNTDHIALYFHANAEDISTSSIFLQHLSDVLSCRLIAMEYPGYSVYQNASPNEDLITANADRMVGFVAHQLGYQLKNVILIGEFTRQVTGLHLCDKHGLSL